MAVGAGVPYLPPRCVGISPVANEVTYGEVRGSGRALPDDRNTTRDTGCGHRG